MPKVSILLPCYNAANYIEECLESIHQQSFQDFEVVIIDDGSTDQTAEILSKWAEKDDHFSVRRIEHSGVIEASNAGLAKCQGEYIARMDADDLMHPDRLKKQTALLDTNPDIDICSCLVSPAGEMREGFKLYMDWLNSLISDEDVRREIFVESPIATPTAMIRSEVIKNFGGYQDRGWPEDYDLYLRLYSAGHKFAKVPEILLYWRDHPTRLTRADSRYSLENFIRAKANYLISGPLIDRDAVIIWGAGMHGKRISKHLLRADVNIVAFVDIDPKKIGSTRKDRPIIPPEEVMTTWENYKNPVIFSAVGARGARQNIRERLTEMDFIEGKDWWGVA